jgi:hypothetical protein
LQPHGALWTPSQNKHLQHRAMTYGSTSDTEHSSDE